VSSGRRKVVPQAGANRRTGSLPQQPAGDGHRRFDATRFRPCRSDASGRRRFPIAPVAGCNLLAPGRHSVPQGSL